MVKILVSLIMVVTLLSGCSITMSGRQSENAETISVTTCGSATTVGDGSCNANVVKLGGGN